MLPVIIKIGGCYKLFCKVHGNVIAFIHSLDECRTYGFQSQW